MLSCQKHLFQIPEHVSYLNCAYFSPLLSEVAEIGRQSIERKLHPYTVQTADFFDPVVAVQKRFAKLIHGSDWQRIAIVPSVSYGMANVKANIQPVKGKSNIVLTKDQFPSNYYPWHRLAQEQALTIQTIGPPPQAQSRGEAWNEQILAAINADTLLVAISHVHWADGTLFDLPAIGQRCRQHGALLIVDATQSIGALPFDVNIIQPDAVVCAAYKWLLGPYGIGLAYYGPYFDNGQPIEDNWINRLGSDDFQNLVHYQDNYRAKAARYSVGEQSNLFAIPMLQAALDQLLDWKVAPIQAYCQQLTTGPIEKLCALGAQIEAAPYRAAHLFGIQMPPHFDLTALQQRLKAAQVFVSLRGQAIRVSPNVYNEAKDFERLLDCLTA
ncbi:MAG: aminotransferase class V-fold PLP-dependent enzyme [Bacteroidota bacterium]